ncbi:hypothetical protein SERLADRAFT_452847 [Serpula lacrymans var. lacrymans S7.9]|uniref:PLP-dependent transferase n=1 Tax=Serpula lacrymans var. lacrymans (strain S7.9) TaxID=578457 RepID=F8P8Y2_SERL9|nr:uncharacterized protein SERLADRAFT_452847 [Serpula lacrymans var. lacrymans S7.9]EGO20111.1 hypothetical protein SERLADRAFT_452847 [Serpula lacrymans var. lacrymans S7.9]
MLGYIAALLYNPNNCSPEASPVTSCLEFLVGKQLCAMVGYEVRSSIEEPDRDEIVGWGHLTSGGTVANLESMWAARNCKFFPLSLKWASEDGNPLALIASSFNINLCTGTKKLLSECSTWELMNITPDEVVELIDRLCEEYGCSPEYIQDILNPYLVQTTGRGVLEKHFNIRCPIRYFVGQTLHYSWPKAAGISGIGEENVVAVPLSITGRIDTNLLDVHLSYCLQRKQAVYAVVVIMGSTEHGLVDPLSSIIQLRTKYRKLGLSFLVHADAAWGGYFATLLVPVPLSESDDCQVDAFDPESLMSPYVREEFLHLRYTDSITIDPHKSGYIPYPAGSLCYRNGKLKNMVTKSASYIVSSIDSRDSKMGIYGVEGSKPGAAAMAVWLSNETIGLHKGGYGMILGESMFTTVKMYSHYVTMGMKSSRLIVVPYIMLPSEQEGKTQRDIIEEKKHILDAIVGRSDDEIMTNPKTRELMRKLGPDLIVFTFSCNFICADGTTNEDVQEASILNENIYQRFSIHNPTDSAKDFRYFIGSSTMQQRKYGLSLTNFKQRLGLIGEEDLFVLDNVAMTPFPNNTERIALLVEEFRTVAEDEAEKCALRNTVTPTSHEFVVQGEDRLYLVYKACFNTASSRYQHVITGDIPITSKQEYLDNKRRIPFATFTARTLENIEITSFINKNSFSIEITSTSPTGTIAILECEITNINTIYTCPLSRRYLEPEYPDTMLFYLYGTPAETFIEHILLRSPNVQLNGRVEIDLPGVDENKLRAEFERGFIMKTDILERARLPFTPSHRPTFFQPGLKAKISLFHRDCHKSRLSDHVKNYFAKGTMVLKDTIYVDFDLLNRTMH